MCWIVDAGLNIASNIAFVDNTNTITKHVAILITMYYPKLSYDGLTQPKSAGYGYRKGAGGLNQAQIWGYTLLVDINWW